jgi:hypothetical protein
MQLQSSQLNRWLIFFDTLKEEGHYKKDEISDRIAFLAVYMPLVRRDCYEFMEHWNTHRVRTQSNRPHTTSGKPWALYEHPEAPAVQCGSIPSADLVDKLAEDLKDYDLDEYLPPVTLAWCYWKMREQGFNPETMTQMDESTSGTGVKDYGQAYIKLRHQVYLYISLNELPLLTETEVP